MDRIHISDDCAGSIGHRARLRRRGRGREYGNIVSLAANDCCLKREGAISREGHIIPGIVLEDDAGASTHEPRDRTANGVRPGGIRQIGPGTGGIVRVGDAATHQET